MARVTANEKLCTVHYRLVLEVQHFPSAEPGQFVQILCADPRAELWSAGVTTRRPFSIGGLRREGSRCEIDILHRVVGPGTAWLASLAPGDEVSVLGPLGKPFPIDRQRSQAFLVGGGIGVPPLLWLAEALHKAGKQSLAFIGARSADLMPLRRDPRIGVVAGEPDLSCPDFARWQAKTLLATDDGSLGSSGAIPGVFADYLRRYPPDLAAVTVYACGPDRMMHAVADVCHRVGLPCLVCLERVMACGMGTCQSCVVRTRASDDPEGWRYELCCTDGPVFDSAQVIWDS